MTSQVAGSRSIMMNTFSIPRATQILGLKQMYEYGSVEMDGNQKELLIYIPWVGNIPLTIKGSSIVLVPTHTFIL